MCLQTNDSVRVRAIGANARHLIFCFILIDPINFPEIPDAKGHPPKHASGNANEVFKPNKLRPKQNFVAAVPPPVDNDDEDGQPSSSAEDYDDDSDSHNAFVKPTRTSSQNGYHHIHNYNVRHNNAIFGHGTGGAAGGNAIVPQQTEVRGAVNEVPPGMGSAAHNCYPCFYKLFPINVLMLAFVRLIS